MNTFDIIRPGTLAEAVTAYRNHGDAMYLSGGMTLVPSLKAHLAAPGLLIDLTAITELHGIFHEDDVLRIGALTRFADVAASSTVAAAIPALAAMAGLVADRHVRNRGTLGGSVANNDPAADFPAAVLALGATLVTDRRRIAAEAYFTGLFETALEEGEILAALEFPVPDAAAYAKHPHPASGYAVAGVFVARFGADWRVAVTGSGAEGVFRLTAAEAAMIAGGPAATIPVAHADLPLFDDPAFPAPFRAAAIGWLLSEALGAL